MICSTRGPNRIRSQDQRTLEPKCVLVLSLVSVLALGLVPVLGVVRVPVHALALALAPALARVPDPVPVGRGADPPAGPGEEIERAREDQIVEVPDVPYDTTGFVRKRSMSKRALRLEADSALHSCSHFPHNPLCEVCLLSHMRATAFHRRVPADRSEQFKPSGPNQIMKRLKLSILSYSTN